MSPHVETEPKTRYPQLAPAEQPTSVHEIAERLFPAYSIPEGSVRLAGCSLEDRFFVRVGFEFADRSEQAFFDGDGNHVDSTTVHSLGLTRTRQLARPPLEVSLAVSRVVEAATRWARRELAIPNPPRQMDIAVIWCKYARGKLRFSIQGNVVDLAFADWTRLLTPPPFICPHTGIRSYHIAATDDGRVVAAEAIARCEETGTRTLGGDLVTCAATGKRVLPAETLFCPISNDRVVRHAALECRQCGMAVHPGQLDRGGVCGACRAPASVRKNDPRLARLLGEYPALDRWGSWKLYESDTKYWISAARWMSRLLIVLDRDTLQIESMAKAPRFRRGWKTIPPERYEDEMGR